MTYCDVYEEGGIPTERSQVKMHDPVEMPKYI